MLFFAYALVGGSIVAAAAAVQASGAAEPEAASEASSTESQIRETLSQCGERRFESSAEALVNGEKRGAKILLCAKPGDSDEQWASALEKSAAQIAASPQVTPESKARLSAEFTAAIARARSGPLAGVAAVSGSINSATSGTALAGASTLPSIEEPGKRTIKGAPLRAADRLEATVPPLPPPPPPASAVAASAAADALLPQPQISIRCLASGESGGGSECDEVRNNTTLLVRAEENFAIPATLRFVRRGDALAEQELGRMRKGQVLRMRVPGSVCKGVVKSELELSTVVTDAKSRKEQAGRSLGPVLLRC